ncbi:GNAT family N-acetyltransferase, partial [Mesorhizobium japonicum]|uniref:GNAT family N-acetyltransferase n=1 Tax=Mesorhizobium japonicum TaxID=2066070 RepID=UPI003B5A9B7B
AATFPLACPPHTTDEAKADFIATHLSEANFDEYLADPHRDLLIAEVDGRPVGYTMLVAGEPHDPDVAGAITTRPTIELSKVYVLPDAHGTGVASELMSASLDAARVRKAAGVWLGVNQENARANRFYEKSGFALVGTKRFLVGGRYEDDYVRELVLALPSGSGPSGSGPSSSGPSGSVPSGS